MRSGSVEDHRPVAWTLKSPLPEDVEPEVHLEWLLDHLPSRLDGLSSITKHWRAGFSFAIHVIRRGSTTFAPPVVFEAPALARVSSMGAYLDVDIYGQ